MSAFEGNRVDYPYIPFIAKRVDVTVGDCPMTAGLIDGLSLLLSGNCGSIFIAAHTALETLCGGLCNRLCNGEMVKVIPSGLGEEEDMLIAPCAAVFYAFRHGVFLHPYDVVAKIPAVVTQGEGQHPRDTDHIFGLAALNFAVEGYGLSVSSVGIFRIDAEQDTQHLQAP